MKKIIASIMLTLTAVIMAAISIPATKVLAVAGKPTPTPKAPMPEGWTSIKESREIHGWQVAINEKNEGATIVDGEWYPVDPNGCYSDKLLADDVQKNPEVIAMNDSLIQKDVFIYSAGVDGTDPAGHYGIHKVGLPWEKVSGEKGGEYPTYRELHYDGIVWRQEICYFKGDDNWHHMLDVVFHNPGKIINESLVSRLAVGWFDQDKKYHTFTYYQEMSIEEKSNRLVYPGVDKKGNNVKETFNLWKPLITDKRHVEIAIPWNLAINSKYTLDYSYDQNLQHLVVSLPRRAKTDWSKNLSDVEFIKWGLVNTNSLKFYTLSEHRKFWSTLGEKNKTDSGYPIWTSYLKNEIARSFPVWFIRTVSVPKSPK